MTRRQTRQQKEEHSIKHYKMVTRCSEDGHGKSAITSVCLKPTAKHAIENRLLCIHCMEEQQHLLAKYTVKINDIMFCNQEHPHYGYSIKNWPQEEQISKVYKFMKE